MDKYYDISEIDSILEYLPNKPFEEFKNLSNADLNMYAILGTKKLDSSHIFKGNKCDINQNLQFPRDITNCKIPFDIKIACFIYANIIYQESKLYFNNVNNIKREKIGRTIETEYKDFNNIDITKKDNNFYNNLINLFLNKYLTDYISVWRS